MIFDSVAKAVLAPFLKAAVRFSGYGGGPNGGYAGYSSWRSRWWWTRPPDDYAADVDPRANSAVMACILWIARTFPEGPLMVVDADDEEVPDHPLTALVADPNPHYDGNLLWMATLADYTASGNAYWLKERAGDGRPLRLWYAPSWTVRPRWPEDGSAFLAGYDYRPDPGREPVAYPPADVVHFRHGLDPATRGGVSPLASVLGEVYSDREAAAFTAALLANLGVPGAVLAPAEGVDITAEEAVQARDQYDARFTGAGRGRSMATTYPLKVQVLGFSPEQMDLKALRRVPEERISAVLGIPAGVAGLGAGLDRNTYANYKEAREAAYESNIIPTQRLMAAAVRRQLLPDFAAPSAGQNVAFDLSRVRVLQEDQDKLAARQVALFAGGVMSLAEARKPLGLEVEPEMEDLYRLPANTTLAPLDQLALPPAPTSAPAAATTSPAGGQPEGGEGAQPPPEGDQTAEPVAAALGGKAVPTLTPADIDRLYAWQLRRVAGGTNGRH